MEEKKLSQIETRANAATASPWDIGITDHSLDPVEWFRGHLSFSESKDVWSVWCPEHPRTKGEYPRPDHAVICAVTGNGPDSEKNAEFIAQARVDVLELIAEVRRLQKENATLKIMVVMHGELNEEELDMVLEMEPVTE